MLLLPSCNLGDFLFEYYLVESVDLFLYPFELVCSHCLPAGVGGWDNGISWVKEGWREKIFVVCCGLGQRNQTRFWSTTDLQICLRGVEDQRIFVDLHSFYLLS